MTIYTTYLEEQRSAQLTQKTLEDVIAQIRSTELQKSVSRIRAETDAQKQRALKGKLLPMFFPTIQVFERNALADDSIPTGIVQFDIDPKDNTKADFVALKRTATLIPECIYAFTSPSGGLKLGIRTDFAKRENETLDSLRERYKQAYKLAQSCISEHMDIALDQSVANVKYPCYLSFDPSAHINETAQTLKVNAECIYIPPVVHSDCDTPTSTSTVQDILAYIPRDFRFSDRLKVNFAVFGCLGESGIPILFSHWSKPEREQLKKQLREQSKTVQYGNIGTLIKIAKKYGYKPTPPAARRKQRAKDSEHKFEELQSVSEAKKHLGHLFNRFFSNNQSMLVNISTGMGKTQTALELLREISPTKKVLYLVGNHQLGDEIDSKYKKVPIDASTFKQKARSRSRIVHIYGRSFKQPSGAAMCEVPETIKAYGKAGIPMPLDQCTNDCTHFGHCAYTQQFSSVNGNIRLMTHNELVNEECAWFAGAKKGEKGVFLPRPNSWKPDYIIVDENWINPTTHYEGLNSSYNSIRNVLNDALNGDNLEDAVKKHKEAILMEAGLMLATSGRRITFTSTREYINAHKNQSSLKYSPVLKALREYVLTEDSTFINPIFLDQKNKSFVYTELAKIAKRYRDIPTLFLDATADERVVKALLGDIEFHTVRVKPKNEINIFQLENYNWTKSRLSTDEDREKLLCQLAPFCRENKSTGLITYKKVQDIDNFDQWLANELGIGIFDHFGNLRGLDKFEDVDCLLIIGRYMVPPNAIAQTSKAIFGKTPDLESVYAPVMFRMKDATTKTIENKVFTDKRMQSCHQQFSISETIQAVGRGRLIHGAPKDIYIFSNESLGQDIQISDFFRYEEPKYQKALDELKKIGFCEDKPKSLLGLGLTEYKIKNYRKEIETEFCADESVERISLNLKDKNRKKRTTTFFVNDKARLNSYLASKNLMILP